MSVIIIIVLLVYRYSATCKQNVVNNRLIKGLTEKVKDKVVKCYTYDIDNYMDGNEHIFLSIKKNYIIANKKNLWLTLKDYYGVEIAQTVTPMTYVIPDDYLQLIKDNKKDRSRLIYKQNNHQQNGIFVSSKLQDLKFLQQNKFIVAQRFIEDTLKWKNYKLSFRLYLILECYAGKLRSHIYEDGLVYYGKGDIASFYYSDELIINSKTTKLNRLYSENKS